MNKFNIELNTSANEEVNNRSFELYKALMDAQITKQGFAPVALEIYMGKNGEPLIVATEKKFTTRALKGSPIKRLRGEFDPIHVSSARDVRNNTFEQICKEFISNCDDVHRALIYLVMVQFSILGAFYMMNDDMKLEERTALLYAIHRQNKLVTEIWNKSSAIDRQGIIACGATPWSAMEIFDKVRDINNEWKKQNLDIAPYFLYKLD